MAYAPLWLHAMAKLSTLTCPVVLIAASSVVFAQGRGAQPPAGAPAGPAAPAAPSVPMPAGDAARGQALFESNGCFDCHRIGEKGSHLGPDLSEIARRSPDRLRQALVAPDEEVLPENRFVRFAAKDGTTVTGRLLNQDAISVQLITPKDELKSYLKASVRQFTILDKGLMPSLQGKLTDQQINDLINYLGSLKGS